MQNTNGSGNSCFRRTVTKKELTQKQINEGLLKKRKKNLINSASDR